MFVLQMKQRSLTDCFIKASSSGIISGLGDNSKEGDLSKDSFLSEEGDTLNESFFLGEGDFPNENDFKRELTFSIYSLFISTILILIGDIGFSSRNCLKVIRVTFAQTGIGIPFAPIPIPGMTKQSAV